ncbi:MAG TPA: PAS domain-containing protein [Candidatus Limnocylindrales bacterium]|nr:PAS domain-containing protein [Candidatus Limnocylindrales bacterium]
MTTPVQRQDFQGVIDCSPDLIIRYDRKYRLAYVNPAVVRAYGLPAEDMVGKSMSTVALRGLGAEVVDAERTQFEQRLESVFETGKFAEFEFTWPTLEGWKTYSVRLYPEVDRDDVVTSVVGVAQDISELKETRRQIHALMEDSPDLIARFDCDAQCLSVNKAMAAAMGIPASELVGRPIGEVLSERVGPSVPEDLRSLFDAIRREAAAGAAVETEIRVPLHAGERIFNVRLTPERDHEGVVASVLLVGRDITGAKRVEETLRESERRFRQVTEAIDEVFWLTDTSKQQIIYISPAYEKIWGRTCASVYAAPESWVNAIDPSDRGRVRVAALTLQSTGAYDIEYRIVRPGGEVRWIHDRAFPIQDEDGRVHRVAGVAEDITVRRQLEDQFRQAQKMEAVGRLAGGVAHDFNNLLTAIMGYAQLMRMRAPSDVRLMQDIQEILKASTRAANLTRQLLTFSRKEPGNPRILDLGALVSDICRMLRPLVGERVNIVVRTGVFLGAVKADPGQIEQVVLNLIVNARDAMPAGGSVKVETDNLDLGEAHTGEHVGIRPGEYVLLAVSDTGIGMDEQTKARIFEPFFTTKAPEKGTGLGLSNVYGIVQQSGGTIRVASDPSWGTTFKIYLPRVEAKAETVPVSESLVQAPRGTETILLVEDQDIVAAVVRGTLQSCGYRILEARNGADALLLWQKHGTSIRLILTDVVMPVMNGPEFVRRAREGHAEVKVLYMSGYTEQGFSTDDLLSPDDGFLPKPFAPLALARKVREVLDSENSLAK